MLIAARFLFLSVFADYPLVAYNASFNECKAYDSEVPGCLVILVGLC